MVDYQYNYYELSKRYRMYKNDMIFPLFVDENDKFQESNVMPGFFKIPYHSIIHSLEEIVENGIHSVILFGIPKLRNNQASSASSPNGVVQKTLRLKSRILEINLQL